jgi:hypothetical protein
MEIYGNAFGGGGGGAGAVNAINSYGYQPSSSGVDAGVLVKDPYSSFGGSGSPNGYSNIVGSDTITTDGGRAGGTIIVFSNENISTNIEINSFGRRQYNTIKCIKC